MGNVIMLFLFKQGYHFIKKYHSNNWFLYKSVSFTIYNFLVFGSASNICWGHQKLDLEQKKNTNFIFLIFKKGWFFVLAGKFIPVKNY